MFTESEATLKDMGASVFLYPFHQCNPWFCFKTLGTSKLSIRAIRVIRGFVFATCEIRLICEIHRFFLEHELHELLRD